MDKNKVIKFAQQVIDNADDTGCSDDLIVTSKAAIEGLTEAISGKSKKSRTPKTTETKSTEEIIQDIANNLAECSGEYIQEIAERILGISVIYDGDSLFEVGEQFQMGDIVNVKSVNNNPPHDFTGTVIGFKGKTIQVRDQDDDFFDVEYSQCQGE